MKYTELVYDAHIAAWVSLEIYSDEPPKKRHLTFNLRSGFYPYEYNFLFGRRDGQTQCSYCGEFFLSRDMTRDHVYPKSQGGVYTTPACYNCNETKASMLPIAWALKISEIEEDTAAVA